MPGLPAGHGDGSPKLHTVLAWVASTSVLVLRSSTEAGRPAFPTVAWVGKDGTALVPTPACAAASASVRHASAAAVGAKPRRGRTILSSRPIRRAVTSISHPFLVWRCRRDTAGTYPNGRCAAALHKLHHFPRRVLVATPSARLNPVHEPPLAVA